jgi:hypothetical protein
MVFTGLEKENYTRHRSHLRNQDLNRSNMYNIKLHSLAFLTIKINQAASRLVWDWILAITALSVDVHISHQHSCVTPSAKKQRMTSYYARNSELTPIHRLKIWGACKRILPENLDC